MFFFSAARVLKSYAAIYPFSGQMIIFNQYKNKEEKVEHAVTAVPISCEADILQLMFDYVKSKLDKTIKAVCICIPSNLEDKKNIIAELAKANGLENVEVVEEHVIESFGAILKLCFTSINNKTIWTCLNGYCCIWQGKICETKKYNLDDKSIEGLLITTAFPPDILIHAEKNEVIDKNFIYELYLYCEIVKCEIQDSQKSVIEYIQMVYEKDSRGEFKNGSDFNKTNNSFPKTIIHVGISESLNIVSAGYVLDDKTYREFTFKINISMSPLEQKNEIEKLLKIAANRINGSYGCICIDKTMQNKEFSIEWAKQFGFKNASVIDPKAAEYFEIVTQLPFEIQNNDIIWINSKHDFYDVGQTHSYHTSGRYSKLDYSRMPKNLFPNFMICKQKSWKTYREKELKNYFPDCQFLLYFFMPAYTYKTMLKYAELMEMQYFPNSVKPNAEEASRFSSESVFFTEKAAHENYPSTEVYKGPLASLIKVKDITPLLMECHPQNESNAPISATAPNGTKQKIVTNGFQFGNKKHAFVARNQFLSTNDKENAQTIPKNSRLEEITSNKYLYKTYKFPHQISISNEKIQVVGIDLGTSRCCAAVNRKNGIIATVHLDNTGERLLPSYVGYDEEFVKCGRVVVNRLRFCANSTVFDSKRIIGRSINDVEIDSIWPFRISAENDKVIMEVKKSIPNSPKIVVIKKNAEDVAADLLKHIKQKSQDFQGTKLDNVVITVPAAFTDSQKEATINAAKTAGWEVIRLLPEPIAAAFAYFMGQNDLENLNVLVFDLGGGTMDVCIFKIKNNEIQIISNTGDTKLGGRDFDTVLFNYFKNQLDGKYGITLDKAKKYKLILECQKIKEDLSVTTSCQLSIDEYNANMDGIISINRIDFESMTKPLLNKIKNTINSALLNSKQSSEEINKILLVGGGSRMPMVKTLLQEIFPTAEQCIHENPDEVVAIGAAYYAYSIFS